MRPLVGKFGAYVMSFVYVGIYWNNHHHLLHTVKRVDGWIMWANMNLLFWLSLVPIGTSWLGETGAAPWPTVLYALILFLCGVSWLLLQRAIIHADQEKSQLARAIGADWKGKLSGTGYGAAVGLAFVDTRISVAIFIALAVVWFIPDRRISRTLEPD